MLRILGFGLQCGFRMDFYGLVFKDWVLVLGFRFFRIWFFLVFSRIGIFGFFSDWSSGFSRIRDRGFFWILDLGLFGSGCWLFLDLDCFRLLIQRC